ncbi:MAG: 4'-phosphopantetheinyl transferase superfamily protein [Candidatus Obscuribacterales bacterium]|nr:4'-phosphopantetheinyl transferase superfamily protein [Candidatus Obscuribacterales bacterium]
MQNELHDYFRRTLKKDLAISFAEQELQDFELSENERLKLLQMKHENRRSSWLRGRAALKQVLKTNSKNHYAADLLSSICLLPASTLSKSGAEIFHPPMNQIDTCMLSLPNKALSLSHNNQLAVALLILERSWGAGIDLEAPRPVKEGATRFYLHPEEQQFLYGRNTEDAQLELLRLWTVKEALFKSDLLNSEKTLLNYRLEDAAAHYGRARSLSRPETFSYSSKFTGQYWLTLAIAEGGS